MSTTNRALITIPAAIMLTLGLGACQDQAVSTPPSQDSQSEARATGSSEPSAGDDGTDGGSTTARERTAGPTQGASAPETSSINSTKIAIGDCIKDPGTGTGSEQVSDVTIVDCSEPHLYEVYAESELTDATLPPTQTIEATAEETCSTGFEDFIGISADASQTYTYTYFYPTQASWDHGDRLISCMVTTQTNTETTGSAKNAAE